MTPLSGDRTPTAVTSVEIVAFSVAAPSMSTTMNTHFDVPAEDEEAIIGDQEFESLDLDDDDDPPYGFGDDDDD